MTTFKQSKRYRITEEEDGFWVSMFASRSYPIPCESYGPFDSYSGAMHFTSEWEHSRNARMGGNVPDDDGGLTINVDLN